MAGSVAWFVAVGGTFGCLLPYLSGDWHFHPASLAARVAGVVLLFWSAGLLRYTIVAWAVGIAAVHWYEEPVLTRKFGAPYLEYRRAVRAWIPRARPWGGPG